MAVAKVANVLVWLVIMAVVLPEGSGWSARTWTCLSTLEEGRATRSTCNSSTQKESVNCLEIFVGIKCRKLKCGKLNTAQAMKRGLQVLIEWVDQGSDRSRRCTNGVRVRFPLSLCWLPNEARVGS